MWEILNLRTKSDNASCLTVFTKHIYYTYISLLVIFCIIVYVTKKKSWILLTYNITEQKQHFKTKNFGLTSYSSLAYFEKARSLNKYQNWVIHQPEVHEWMSTLHLIYFSLKLLTCSKCQLEPQLFIMLTI